MRLPGHGDGPSVEGGGHLSSHRYASKLPASDPSGHDARAALDKFGAFLIDGPPASFGWLACPMTTGFSALAVAEMIKLGATF